MVFSLLIFAIFPHFVHFYSYQSLNRMIIYSQCIHSKHLTVKNQGCSLGLETVSRRVKVSSRSRLRRSRLGSRGPTSRRARRLANHTTLSQQTVQEGTLKGSPACLHRGALKGYLKNPEMGIASCDYSFSAFSHFFVIQYEKSSL
jgi:hypothetical protein